ncbi:MAG TPA: M1 family aminopeptidase [Candidatus Kapabacteria bacterium]|nr:M1 family aminopeptidase [Candidatus Kapabacteria bacterium]
MYSLRHALTLFIFSIVLLPCSICGQVVTHNYDVKHYDETLTFDIANRALTGTTVITANATSDTLDTLFIYLTGEQMQIDSISGAGGSFPFQRIGDSVVTTLKQPVAPGKSFQIKVQYHGNPTNEGGNTGLGGVYFDTNRVYTMSMGLVITSISAARFWMPCYDLPDDKATITLHITVPSQYTAVSAGALTNVQSAGGNTTYTWNETHPVALNNVGIAVAPFTHTQLDSVLHADLYSVGTDTAINSILKNKIELALPFFDSLYAPFPFDKLSFTQVAARALSQQSQIEYDSTVASSLFDKTQIVGWIAKEWWGAFITPQYASEFWLQEALATYSQALFIQHTQGDSAYAQFLDSIHTSYYQDAQYEQALTLEEYNRLFPSSNFPATLSEKGAAVIAMLRRLVGDSVFFSALQKYVATNTFGWMTTQTFEDAFTQKTTAPVQDFFDSWVRDSGWAQLNVSWSHAQKDDSDDIVSLHISQTQQSHGWQLFSMPVNILFHSYRNSGELDTTENTVYLQQVASQDTSFTIRGHVTSMIFNPDNVALADVQTLTDVRSLSLVPQLPSVRIFPDPLSQDATIQIGPLPVTGSGIVEIINAQGRIVKDIPVQTNGEEMQTLRFSATSLPNGVYFLRFRNNNLTTTQKFTVVH